MRLAYVLERYPELTQTFVEAELRELARAGDAVDVLALQAGDGADLAEAASEPAYPAPGAARVRALLAAAAARPRASGRYLASGGRSAGASPPAASAASRAIAPSWPPDGRRLRGLARAAGWRDAAARAGHIHAHFASEAADIAELLGALTGRPHSFTGHSTDLFADPAALRHRLAVAAFAVVICDYDRREVERIAPGAGRLHVIPLGLDLDAIRRTEAYRADGPVVAVGRLVEHKGFADLAAVAGELGREVVIAGEGPQRAELERLGGDAVRLPGALTPAAARELIEGAAVLVAPSVIARDGSRDGIPMVLKEALALATPIVASDAVGNPEVIEPAHGALHPAGDRRALAEAVRSVLSRPPAEREAMGRAGRAWAEREADLRRQTARLRELFAGGRRAAAVTARAGGEPPR
jgi:glycosyltransferase involved in cell wall biosynthesis